MTRLNVFFKLLIITVSFTYFTATFAASETSDAAIASSILATINSYRIHHGLPALQMNAYISEQARKHSQDMANHHMSFGHQGFSTRIKAIYAHIPGCRGGAENVAFNYKPSQVGKGWIASPGHKRNIIGHYNLTGIGIARDKNGKLYYTQMFIRAN